jgi:hypothetical protein
MIVRGGVRKLAVNVFICEKVFRLRYLVHRSLSLSFSGLHNLFISIVFLLNVPFLTC